VRRTDRQTDDGRLAYGTCRALLRCTTKTHIGGTDVVDCAVNNVALQSFDLALVFSVDFDSIDA